MSDTGPGNPQGRSLPEPPPPATGPGSFGGPVPLTGAAGAPQTGSHRLPDSRSEAEAPEVPATVDAERRRKRLLIGGIAGGVVVIVVIAAVLVSQRGDQVALPAPSASTVLLPVPTPTLVPVARVAPTVFASVLPTTLLQYVLASSAPEASWVSAGAVEAYSEAYSDGGSGKVVVLAGQWETPAAADAAAKQLIAAVPSPTTAPRASASSTATAGPSGSASVQPPETGNVTAAGQTVGTYLIRDVGDGTGVAVWTNGASVFRATAPIAEIHNVYAAYPL
jgi:hypothetical protein